MYTQKELVRGELHRRVWNDPNNVCAVALEKAEISFLLKNPPKSIP